MSMEIKFLTVLWMFNIITVSAQQIDDESISFSPIISKISNSYWQGNLEMEKESFFLEEGIGLQITVNKYQGLLFYAIDNSYRTFWVEFKQDILEIRHYNFIINSTDKRNLKISDLRSNINSNEFNMTFYLFKNEIKIQSNGKYQTIDYSKLPNPPSTKDLNTFYESFDLPIPIFNTSQGRSQVYIWIGNTPPTTDKQQFRNIGSLRNYDNNLWGCVMFFTIKHIKLKLATSGNHIGEMIRPHCKPICNSNTCLNSGHCTDLWRKRFSCDCGPSKYIGKRCEIEHSVKFNGSFTIDGKHTMKLLKLRFTFNANIYEEYSGLYLLSLKFMKNQFFQVYIDIYGKLHARFFSKPQSKLDNTFQTKLVNHEFYSFFAEIDMDGIQMNIYNSLNRTLLETQKIHKNRLNLFVEKIMVGGSHIYIMDSLKNFRGCVSNLILTSSLKDFTWDEMEKFKQSPKCGKPLNSVLKRESLRDKEKTEKSAILKEKSVNEANYNYTAYILIAVVSFICLLIILIIVITIKIHSRKSNKDPTFHIPGKFLLEDICYNPKDSFKTYRQNEIFQNEDFPDTAPCHIYPAPIYMTYKPAYKAKSLCSSITNRSLISLPISPTPTLATPEDGERL